MANQGKGNMLAILFRVEAKPGKRQALIDFLNWDCEVCRSHERRTLRFDVLRDPKTEEAFYVYEAYADAAAFEEHKKNEPYQRWSSAKFQDEVVADYKELFRGEPVCSP